MAKKNKQVIEAPAAPAPRRAAPPRLLWLAGAAASVIIAFFIYSPALNGPFVFDDRYLPFMRPEQIPLRAWLGVRPALGLSYWLTYQAWGLETWPYHATNVLFHGLNAWLIGFIAWKLLAIAGESGNRAKYLAALAAAVFLTHPVQTESVAYVASRSEAQSAFFALGSLAAFLAAGPGASVAATAGILLLFVAGVTTKEHVMVLPAIFVLTDLYRGGMAAIRRNWRVYSALTAGVAVGGYFIWRVFRFESTIGFGMAGLQWYEYLFTQFRAIWVYIRLYLLPVGLNADREFAISRTLIDHGAILGLLGLLAALFAAWRYRRQFPLAVYGLAVFLVLLAPTSSFVPIKDVIAERRVYLPMIGLLLITVDLVRRYKWTSASIGVATGVLALVLGLATAGRSAVWGDQIALWKDTVQKSPAKIRPRLQLAYFRYQEGDCAGAVRHYEAASQVEKTDVTLLVNWALSLDCLGRRDEALARLGEAEKLEQPAHLYATMGMVLGKSGRHEEALAALAKAEAVDANHIPTYMYKGDVLLRLGRPREALDSFSRAAALDPANEQARAAVAAAQQKVRAF